ncbi:secretion-regulating guanine nucleotide exchange factor isoform X2 [Schistocerca piceifrons]|uniref:secretion-regulating guanine nucleotide exchange factor isoform X2 n=1 Tax=Schistocerca piceifrons TaxID=274613 RepID=UPI001F5FC8F2|nr:secretion-regulating guanine nucleotide exchange factor isoform X2 [Schistocerca piceifrons]
MKLLAWGANTYGQLGVGYKSELCAEPVEVRAPTIDPKLLTRLCGGGGHTLILDKNGNIYSCGWNNKGQLGRSVEEQATSFEHIAALSGHHIIDISCGWETSFALTRDGKLFGWGSNVYGQLSLPRDQVTFSASPLQLTDHKVKQLSSGLRHTAVVTEQGDVFVCGSGRKGQLGIVHHGQPLKESYTLQHEEGKIVNWGRNNYGQLGCAEKQRLESWKPTFLNDVPSTKQIAVGSEHNVALSENSEVLCWGWNEHGSCATGADVDVKSPKKVENAQKAVLIGTGGAHSFAVASLD